MLPKSLPRHALLNKVQALAEQGHKTADIRKALGIADHTVKSCFEDLGIPLPAPRKPGSAERYRKARAYLCPEVKSLWMEGWSVKKIAAKIGRSRMVVQNCLRDLGLPCRSRSTAMYLRMSGATPDYRKALARAANAAARNSPRTTEQRHRAALTAQRSLSRVGKYEEEIGKYLAAERFEIIPQFAWRRYNFDFYILNLRCAVEVITQGIRPVLIGKNAMKTMEVLSAGISVAEIWIQHGRGERPTPAMYDQLVAFLNIARPLPSGLGQYRVIRGDGSLDPRSQTDLNDLADIAIRYRSLQTGGKD